MDIITPDQLYNAYQAPGWTRERAIELLDIHPRTWNRWMRGISPIPRAPYTLLCLIAHGELPQGGRAWEGWRFVRGLLVSPENIEYSAGDIRALPIQYARIEALERELRERDSAPAVGHFVALKRASGNR